ncbi:MULTISPECIES: response regulator [unclassified Plantibacter]|uniref:response regulator n=1 Tax=unclassified Plantibacter TaxID=2624265 RepID=UPI003D34C259
MSQTLAKLTGGPLDGEIIPLEEGQGAELVLPFGEGQLVYRQVGGLEDTGAHDGPTTANYTYEEATEDISPGNDD